MEIFRTLMRTRRMPVHFDHVGALNLIEIEFANDKNVIAAWKEYFKSLNERLHPEANDAVEHELTQRRENLLTRLISEIAKVLHFQVEQLDILEGNYLPQAWGDEEWEQKIARKSLIDVLAGRRPILIQPYVPNQGIGPYPPAPSGVTKTDE